MVASTLAVLRLVLVVRSSPLLATALPPVFWDQPSGQCFSRSCRHCFVAVDVGHPLCGLPWLVVVVVLAMFRFAFVVLSSRLRATQVSPLTSLWGLAYTPDKFSFLQRGASFAIIVSWQSSFGRAWSDSAVSRGIFVSRGRWVGDLAGVDIRRHLSSSEHFSYRSSSCLFSLHGGCRSLSCSLVCLLFS